MPPGMIPGLFLAALIIFLRGGSGHKANPKEINLTPDQVEMLRKMQK